MASCSDSNVTPTVRLDTKGFCIFCLKRDDRALTAATVKQEIQDDDKEDDECEKKVNTDALEVEVRIRRQFSRVFSRYLGTNFRSLVASPNNNANEDSVYLNRKIPVTPHVDISFICTDCVYLVDKICHLFHAMTQLEMQLDWKARQLRSIMAFAKRAPTRVKVFREQFNDSSSSSDMEELDRIERFRKELLDKTSKKFRTAQPRIIFKRKGSRTSTGSRRKSAKGVAESKTTNNVEQALPTESFTLAEMSSISLGRKTSKSTGSPVNQETDATPQENTNCLEENTNTDHEDNCFSSPVSPCTVNLDSEVEELNTTHDDDRNSSVGCIRIRNIESLSSPTKSVIDESPLKKTRTSSRIAALNSGKLGTSDANREVCSLNDKVSPSNEQSQQKSLVKVNSVIPSVTPAQMHALVRKSTLAEWLQSTFNCNKCNKMFISETTLNVHKTTCGINTIENTTQPVQSSIESEESSEHDEEELPLDVSTTNGEVSSEEEEDPLGEGNEQSKEATNNAEQPSRITTCTIRIIKETTSPETKRQAGTRYCKYCSARLSINHFNRHRETLKHKQNKRAHKKAKKLGMTADANGGFSRPANTVVGTVSGSETGAPMGNHLMGENVKIVKIIHVRTSKNVTALEGTPELVCLDESQDGHQDEQQKDKEIALPVPAGGDTGTSNDNNIIIDITED